VQSYWSEADKAYVIPDNGPAFVNVNNGTLFVSGDQGGTVNDTITLSTSGSDQIININGQVIVLPSFDFPDGIVVSTKGGTTNTLNVEGTLAPLTINLGSGTDTVNITPTSRNLENIHGNVLVHGGSGFDTLNLNDQNFSDIEVYELTSGSVTASRTAAVFSYDGINHTVLNGGSGNVIHFYSVLGTSPFATTINTNAGTTGTDSVRVKATTGSLEIVNHGGGGTDSVTIGDAGSLKNIN